MLPENLSRFKQSGDDQQVAFDMMHFVLKVQKQGFENSSMQFER